MSEQALRRTRIVSVIAVTVISLACGTNYVYSAWGPQFAERLRFSATESNLIGTFGNLGMYATGIPAGLLIDAKGPRPGVLVGWLLIGSGYFFIRGAYEAGQGAVGLPWICLFSFFTGAGSASAFSAALKTAALNWPNHRGTATGFPLSAFGLSAVFFASISSFLFGDNTSDFLLLLAVGTTCMTFFSIFFVRVVPNMPKYAPLLDDMGRSNGNPLKRTKSNDGMGIERESDESSSLVFQAASEPEDLENGADKTDADTHDPHHLDIRGMAMLPTVEFWQLFMMLCLLAGIGLMTINNIGNDAQALWSSWDKTVTPGYIQRRQLMHVSIISFFSFVGRLSSGVGSDVIVKKLHMSRFWCLFVSSAIFCVGQICGATISNPNFLFVVSSTTGLAYGFLFGVYPSLVADTFGVHGLSQNWGWMTLAPVISGNIFNLLYGHIFDANSIINEEDGTRKCLQGIHCYKTAYWVTFGAGMFGVVVSLWSIHHDGAMKRRRRKELEERDA